MFQVSFPTTILNEFSYLFWIDFFIFFPSSSSRIIIITLRKGLRKWWLVDSLYNHYPTRRRRRLQPTSSLYVSFEEGRHKPFQQSSFFSFASPCFISLSTFVMVVHKLRIVTWKLNQISFWKKIFIPSLITWLRHISHKTGKFHLNWEEARCLLNRLFLALFSFLTILCLCLSCMIQAISHSNSCFKSFSLPHF